MALKHYMTITEIQAELGIENRQVILNHVKRKNLGEKVGWYWLVPRENLEKLREAITQ